LPSSGLCQFSPYYEHIAHSLLARTTFSISVWSLIRAFGHPDHIRATRQKTLNIKPVFKLNGNLSHLEGMGFLTELVKIDYIFYIIFLIFLR